MPRIVNNVLGLLVSNKLTWKLLRHLIVRPGHILQELKHHQRTLTRRLDLKAETEVLAPDKRVLNGPFKGLYYSRLESTGSSLFPKLLGSYERELHAVIELGDGRGYTTVVDIGCAEGYYAVGLARRWPNVEVYAFDINPDARALCQGLALDNGVGERVHVGGVCDAQVLRELYLTAPSLIISDCEGYELELFTEDLIRDLAQHDFLIELHDWYDVTISSTLKQRFSGTHTLESIYSVDDIQKVHLYDYPEIDRWSLHDRRALLSERRPYVMEWIFCKSQD